jgi:Flp pilus assembly protein TadG
MKYRRGLLGWTPAATIAQSIKAFWGDTDGVILPYVTMMLVVVVGVSVLALDGSRYFSLQTQLQNGADALALACDISGSWSQTHDLPELPPAL